MEQHQRTVGTAKRVAKRGAVGGARAFETRVFKPWWTKDGERGEAPNYAVRLMHGGRRETVNLLTPDVREAARRASRFQTVLRGSGWDAAFADLSPELTAVRAARGVPTVGELIAAAGKVAVHVKPGTLYNYGQCLRQLTGLVVPGGEPDKVSLAVLSSKAIEAAVAGYVKARGAGPSARRTAASLVKQARGLWSKKLLRILPFENLPHPFHGVLVDAPRAPKYLPTFDVAALVGAARSELRMHDDQVWLAFLLCLAGGLRKSEADRLTWTDVDLERGTLRVVTGKTVDSIGDVQLGPETVAELTRLRGPGRELHVLVGNASHRLRPAKRTYRATATFDRLKKWLRAHGVADSKPIHALRKEAGSLINAANGIHAASRFLRHGDIGVTASHYADARTRVVVPLPAAAQEAGK